VGDVGKAADDDIDLTGIDPIDIELDWHAPASTIATAPDVVRQRPRFDPRWLILVAVVAFVAWALGVGGGTDEAAPIVDSAPTTTASPVSELVIDDGRAALVGDPSLDLATAITEVSEIDFQTAYLEMQVNPNGVDVFAVVKQFATVPGGFRFGYVGVDGRPVVIDTGTGEFRSVVDELPFETDTGFAVLPDGGGTIGLDPVRPTGAWRVADDIRVVRRHTGELFGVRETTTGVEYGPVDDRDAWDVLPAGASVRIEPAVGVFLTPTSGGIFELTPEGVESVTPFEMITTNGTRWVERRRVEGPDEYWVVDRSGDAWLLDREVIDVDGDLSISPDGAWVFAADGLVGSDFPAFWGVETGAVVEVESRADRLTPVWAPDSSFVAELDPTRNCIWINFISGLNGCIVLDKLNVPALEASALVVY
jgi:hypothetical protein